MVAVAGRQALAFARVAAVVLLCITGWQLGKGNGELGVNWGTISHDPLPNNIVVKLLQDNNFAKVKLFDADPNVIESMRGTNLEVMVAITNDMLAAMAAGTDAAAAWVKQNVTAHLGSGGVNIKYVLSLLLCTQLSSFHADMILLKKSFRFGVGSTEPIELKSCSGRRTSSAHL